MNSLHMHHFAQDDIKMFAEKHNVKLEERFDNKGNKYYVTGIKIPDKLDIVLYSD